MLPVAQGNGKWKIKSSGYKGDPPEPTLISTHKKEYLPVGSAKFLNKCGEVWIAVQCTPS
jgi:hypothetical protein